MILHTIGFIALVMFGLAGSALFSGLETGIYCLSRVRLSLRADRHPPDRAARMLLSEVDHTIRTLATLLIGNNLFNYVAVLGLTVMLQRHIESKLAVIALIAVVFTPVLLVVGESLPKELFRVGADRLTYRFARSLVVVRWVFTFTGILPAVMLFDRAAARITGASGSEAFGRDARGRIATLLKEGATLGVLTESQTRLIDRALALRNATVRDEMIPWRTVRCAQATWDRAALMQHIGATTHARLPVVGADGSVRGVLWNLDAYLDTGENWAALVREPARLGPETTVREALKALGESPARVGIVEKDGRPIGLITGKDLVEPLIGEVAAW